MTLYSLELEPAEELLPFMFGVLVLVFLVGWLGDRRRRVKEEVRCGFICGCEEVLAVPTLLVRWIYLFVCIWLGYIASGCCCPI